MKYILIIVLLANYGVIFSQNLTSVDYEILETIICQKLDEKIKIESSCFYSISRFDFYQDSTNYHMENQPSDRIRIGHSPFIEYYDKIPYTTIQKYTQVDTSMINQFLGFSSDGTEWNKNEIQCRNLKIKNSSRFNKFGYRIFRPIINIFTSRKFTIIGRPIYIESHLALIQKTYLQKKFGKGKWIYFDNLFLLKNTGESWVIIEAFVLNTE